MSRFSKKNFFKQVFTFKPKVHLLHHITDNIVCFGSMLQYETENGEQFNKFICKYLFKTNHHSTSRDVATRFDKQFVCWRLCNRGSYIIERPAGNGTRSVRSSIGDFVKLPGFNLYFFDSCVNSDNSGLLTPTLCDTLAGVFQSNSQLFLGQVALLLNMNINFNTPIEKMYSLKTTLSFPENDYLDKQSVLEAVNEYALSNNFSVKIKDVKFPTLHLACSKAGAYCDKCNISEDKRKKAPNSSLTGCPFLLRFSFKNKSQRYLPLPARGDNEHCHNHPITPNNLASSHQGRMSLLTLEDAIIAKTMLENHAKTRDIQKATRDKITGMRKLRISNINNLKYSSSCGGESSIHGATGLIRTMKAKGFSVLYQFNERKSLTHIFFTNETIVVNEY
ncbi:hypothetical protein PHYBLDRAFT_72678 [Phycomyces blakesleeanus NRRL 1555(-)]|uniref:Uncharacterized protein n=1 Tax=Phycomyces blakesleeanus (strain ATCC 8743b / DSM 1359 / FGSC 10004 / NBRC 33097 / NRRL 1555) TaxID=763407 RepID=A0A162NBK9_PHYB8|nr:hypothetical protein PHYBLDRAFT_72678 [Phycomyces blakesleeanus NRRL 1555(-)]OAD67654.1 hypothetical protein PHYBLDRAFT_72678 [Phycomyces blakesleeanus NRRL 1555(-)]|eukprot:XP_018285694.1 hypothetical protein PHYBLDRAFT_72678 [Phycomyces blakesleeanus NRRL 1555(-)]